MAGFDMATLDAVWQRFRRVELTRKTAAVPPDPQMLSRVSIPQPGVCASRSASQELLWS